MTKEVILKDAKATVDGQLGTLSGILVFTPKPESFVSAIGAIILLFFIVAVLMTEESGQPEPVHEVRIESVTVTSLPPAFHATPGEKK